MNKVILIGRLTAKPDIRDTQNSVIAFFTLAVDRRYRDQDQTADFLRCMCFGKTAEFAEKYLEKGTKVAAVGRIQTGTYEKDGDRHYTTDIIIEELEFAESKKRDAEPEEKPARRSYSRK